MSKSIEIATFDEAINVESFSEPLLLPVDEEMTPTQLSFSPVIPNKITKPIQAANNELEKRSIIFYCVPPI